MLILELRCNRCGARGGGSVRPRSLKGHQLREMAKGRGWGHDGKNDYCTLCWPLIRAEGRHVRELARRRP